ncbi:MAG: FprA family A-type flavoprotein [Eubacteriales bacterium]|nr:FprA family A-type flavoprotein [Eubacteriales bacterium]
MLPRKLDDGFYLLCGIDRRLERFENMFVLPYGVSYNSYFLDCDEPVLIDSTDASVADECMAAVEGLLDGRELAHLICNHVEPDHVATIQRILDKYPQAKLHVSKLGYQLLCQFNSALRGFEDRVVIVDEGSKFEVGKYKFYFIKAANVHWPEVTFCYEATTKSLFSADAFGSFAAPAGHIYADQVHYNEIWLSEARRYYTNIVGRQGKPTQRALEKAAGLDIEKIYPLHGLLFRTPETISFIIEKYQHWSRYKAEEAGSVIVYSSMYNHSQQLADSLAAYLADASEAGISIYDVSKTNVSFIVADLFRYSHAVFVCNNYNTELYPRMDALLRELMMLNWDNHTYSLACNMSWGGRAVAIAQEILGRGKNLTKIGDNFTIKSSLQEENKKELQQLAKDIIATYADFTPEI